MKKIYTIIIHFDSLQDTNTCLQSLSKVEKNNFEIKVILINNGSEKEGQFQKRGLNLEIITPSQNIGFAQGNNVGIKTALKEGAHFIFLLNNDTEVNSKIFINLLKEATEKKEEGIFGPKIYFAPGYEYHFMRYKDSERGKVLWYAGGKVDWKNLSVSHRGIDEIDMGQYDKTEQTDFVSGCAMFIKRKVLEKIGPFDSKFFLYFEDLDFCYRAKKAGFPIFYIPKAFLWHRNKGVKQSTLQDYYFTRNKLLFVFKFFTWRKRFLFLKEAFRILLNGRSWQKRGVMDFFLKRLGKGSYHE